MIKEQLAQDYGDKYCCMSIDCESRRHIVDGYLAEYQAAFNSEDFTTYIKHSYSQGYKDCSERHSYLVDALEWIKTHSLTHMPELKAEIALREFYGKDEEYYNNLNNLPEISRELGITKD